MPAASWWNQLLQTVGLAAPTAPYPPADQPFIQAICDDPAEDAPRLVYADWLEETGRPDRAEVIRVQCDLARLPPDDPGRPALRSREQELLQRHGWAWAVPFRDYVLRTARTPPFRRGFTDGLTLLVGDVAWFNVSLEGQVPISSLAL